MAEQLLVIAVKVPKINPRHSGAPDNISEASWWFESIIFHKLNYITS